MNIKQFYELYEKDNKKLERFIKVFKPEVKEIVLDKVSSHSAKKIKKFAYSNPKYISYKK